MENKKTDAPSNSSEFDKAYHSGFHWVWTDTRIPKELKKLVEEKQPKTSLELGCGLGRFSSYLAQQGIHAVGVDFSEVAIGKAKKRVAEQEQKPTFLTGDVTNLETLTETFDVSFDIGCFHCLNEENMQKYVAEVHRLLKPDSTHLLWVLGHSPSDVKLHPEYINQIFGDKFQLVKSQFSRRRIVASYWFWLVRK